MELKSTLDQYDEPTFLELVETIWNVETDQASHDALITHFDSIVGHPSGSDLLFYANPAGIGSYPGAVVESVKSWHQQNGRAAFKGQVLQAPPATQTLDPQQRATRSSSRNLEKVRKLVTEVQACEQRVTMHLAALEHQLDIDPVATTPNEQLAVSLDALRALESAQHQARRSVADLERLRMPVKFAFDGAVRDTTSPFLDAGIQAVVLTEVTAVSQRHATALASAQVRHPVLYARGVTLIESLEARIAQLAKDTGSGPGHAPLTLTAAAHAASRHPTLLTAKGLSREMAQLQHALIKTFRSAVAELEWQATSLQEDHPGHYVDLMKFTLSTPSDDPRFALTLPLDEIVDGELLDWVGVAEQRGEVQLPVRLCSMVRSASGAANVGVKPFTQLSHVVMTLTLDPIVPSRVRVRQAAWDATHQAYLFTSESGRPVSVRWQEGSTPYAPRDPASPPSVVFLSMPPVPLMGRFADVAQIAFDDYVVVFPASSGVPPLYLMFSDTRHLG